MMRASRDLLGSLFFAGALAGSLGLTGCWVVVGGEDKVLVDADEGRGGRTGKSPTQGGASGSSVGEGGTAGTAAGAAGQAAIAGAGGLGGAGAGTAGSAGSAGASVTGGASGASGASGGSGPGGTGQGGAAGAGAASGSGGSAGAPSGGASGSSSGSGGSGGGAGKGGAAGAMGGSAGQSGAGGAGGATGNVQTGPGQFSCAAEPAKSSYPFCTNFSPAPGGWEEFTGCNTRPMTAGNTTFLWSSAQNTKCGAYLDATKPLTPKRASLSLWVRAKEIGVAQTEPVLNFTTLTVGTGLDASIGVRQTRNGLGAITGNILVVTSSSLPTGTLDIGAFPLDVWHHVTVTLGFEDGKLVVGGGYGLTSADELSQKSVDTQKTAAAGGSVVMRLSFIQTEFLAGTTTVEVDDLYLH